MSMFLLRRYSTSLLEVLFTGFFKTGEEFLNQTIVRALLRSCPLNDFEREYFCGKRKQETVFNLFQNWQRIDNISLWVRDNLIIHPFSFLSVISKATASTHSNTKLNPFLWSDFFLIRMHKTVLRTSRIYFKYQLLENTTFFHLCVQKSICNVRKF